mmetsp:Transcript_30039/g.72938  ORF Transcript_30039/g.72938 Transcript_30039/m.72938 type:complete len:601 (-) Transcript_30039:1364-3166(-)
MASESRRNRGTGGGSSKRRDNNGGAGGAGGGSGGGTSIELAVFLLIGVVFLYFLALTASIKELPEPFPGSNGGRHLGGSNLNIANLNEDNAATKATASSAASNNGGNTDQQSKTTTTVQQHQQPDNTAHAPKPAADGGGGGGSLGSGTIPIPDAKWPVTLRDELDDFETMIHVGDGKTEMSVPKFWSPPLHNKQRFTREQAMKVGTCAEPDPKTGSSVRGDDCPTDERTIFIAIASYRDYQCRDTVASAFERAANPMRVRVSVVDQIVEGEDIRCNEPKEPCDEKPGQALCKYKNQIDVYTVPAVLSVGPVFARHIGYRMYRGEYYATQSDAHVTFTTDWDNDIIDQMEATHNDMAVLTSYLTDVQGSIDPVTGSSLRHTRPIMCNTYYEGGPQGMHLRHGSQPERTPTIHGSPQLQPWWAAGYSFSRGHFVVNVPYDYLQPMIFQGEEMSIGIRGFTVGYDFYAPERSVCFHHYAALHKERNNVKHFWENGDKYKGTGKKAMKRLLGIVHMNPEVDRSEWDHAEEDRYGIGGVRTPEQFYKYFGIDVLNKKTQGHLCMFVGDKAAMHKMWTPLLRRDGMGIDYSSVDYAWIDPQPSEQK